MRAPKRGGRQRHDGLRRVLRLLQLLPRRGRAAPRRDVLRARASSSGRVSLGCCSRSAFVASTSGGRCWSKAGVLPQSAAALGRSQRPSGMPRLIMYGLRTWWIGAVGHDRADAARRSAHAARRRARCAHLGRRWRSWWSLRRLQQSLAAHCCSTASGLTASDGEAAKSRLVSSRPTSRSRAPPRGAARCCGARRDSSRRVAAFFGAGALLLIAGFAPGLPGGCDALRVPCERSAESKPAQRR